MVFEFFVAFIGIAYFAAKIGTEKARKAETKSLDAAYQADKEAWLSRWADQRLEHELEEFVSNYRNYDQVYREISQTLAELPILQEYVGFGTKWDECGMYSYYWKQRGLSKKAAVAQAYAMRQHIVDAMLASRGKAPNNWSYYQAGSCISGCTAPVELAIFRWCVKRLRAYGMSDPVVRIEWHDGASMPGWTYTLRPLFNEQIGCLVSDEEIVMMPK